MPKTVSTKYVTFVFPKCRHEVSPLRSAINKKKLDFRTTELTCKPTMVVNVLSWMITFKKLSTCVRSNQYSFSVLPITFTCNKIYVYVIHVYCYTLHMWRKDLFLIVVSYIGSWIRRRIYPDNPHLRKSKKTHGKWNKRHFYVVGKNLGKNRKPKKWLFYLNASSFVDEILFSLLNICEQLIFSWKRRFWLWYQ